jgi:hypothetical protein
VLSSSLLPNQRKKTFPIFQVKPNPTVLPIKQVKMWRENMGDTAISFGPPSGWRPRLQYGELIERIRAGNGNWV